MVDFRSKKIKKFKLDLEKEKLESHGKQKQKQLKQKIVLKKNQKHLVVSNRKLAKKEQTTLKFLQLDDNIIKKAIASLKKFNLANRQSNGAIKDRMVQISIQVQNKVHLQELAPQMIKLKYPMKSVSFSAIFILNEKSQLLTDTLKSLQGRFEIITQADVLKREIKELKEFFRKFTLRFVDISIYKSFLMKTNFQKSQDALVYPFHPQRIPFEIKKTFAIEQYKDYIQRLLCSTYVYLTQDIDFNLNVGQITMDEDKIYGNITEAIYSVVPKMMANSVKNHVKKIFLSVEGSIKLEVYNQIRREMEQDGKGQVDSED